MFLFTISKPKLTVVSGVSQSGRCDLHKGLRIEVTTEPLSMRRIANVIIALQRLKPSQSFQSTEFTDQELFNIFMENVIEGEIEHIILQCIFVYILSLLWCDTLLSSSHREHGDQFEVQ